MNSLLCLRLSFNHEEFMLRTLLSALFLVIASKAVARPQEQFSSKQEWFNAFLRATDQKIVLKEAILTKLQGYPTLWENIVNQKVPFSFLFVGAGNGGIEIPLMETLIEKRGTAQNFSVYCEDPSIEMKNGFYQAADDSVATTIKEYSLLPFEDRAYEPPQADFVMASHVWYYVSMWRNVRRDDNSLNKFALAISPDGVGLITLHSKTSDRFALLQAYAKTISAPVDVCGEDVCAALQSLDVAHQNSIIVSRTSLKNCYKKRRFDPNEEGKKLLSFLLRTSWDSLSPKQKRIVENKLEDLVSKNKKEELLFRDSLIWVKPVSNR
jgi:hypothetical protein